MRKIVMYSVLMLIIVPFCSFNCKKEPPSGKTSAEITVKNASKEVIENINVYLFEQPASALQGRNPTYSISSAITNTKGVAGFDLDKLITDYDGSKLYFTVVEVLMSGEISALGSVEVTLTKGKKIIKDLQISDRKLYYGYGYLPATISSRLAWEEYNRWKSSTIVACNDGLRPVADPPAQSLVEAVGFGMLLSAYARDQATFDGIFKFYKSKRTPQSMNMMGWKVTCDGIIDPGSATDGDIDVAFALLVAHKQWGGNYRNEGIEIINIIKNYLITQCTVKGQIVRVLHPGYSASAGGAWGGCGLTDIQYYTPAFFRVFATVTGDDVWNQLANDSYVLLKACANATTGLVPDWHTAEGVPGPDGRVGYFGYDACRVPWRMALDYLWNGNAESLTWCQKISNWAYKVEPSKIVDGYELNGTPIGKWGLNSAFLGGFSVSAMSNSPVMVNDFASELKKLSDNYWFSLNTRVLYLFTLTGNFWNPLK